MWVVVILILTTTTWTVSFFFSILAEWSTLIYFVPYSLWVQRKHMSLERQKVQTSRRILTLWKQKAPLRSTWISASIMSSTSYWGRDFWNIVEPEYFEIKIIVYLLEKRMPPQMLLMLLMPQQLLHLPSSQQNYQASYDFVGNPYYLSDSLGFFTAGWVFEQQQKSIKALAMSPRMDLHVKGGIEQLIIVKRIPQMMVLRKTSIAIQMRMYPHGVWAYMGSEIIVMYPSVKLHALMLTQKPVDVSFCSKVTTGASSAPQDQGVPTCQRWDSLDSHTHMMKSLRIIRTWVWLTILIVAIQMAILGVHGVHGVHGVLYHWSI